MCLDICPPAGVPRAELEEAVRRTTLWAQRQRQAERAPGQLLFGIAQGAADPELRRLSIEEIAALDFDGHALGGLAVGESREEMFEATAWAAPLLPAEKPRYFMGIGDAEGSSRDRGGHRHVRLRPPDPHRTHRLRAHRDGPAESRNARFARDPRPLEEGCACPACARFSRAYIRHLVNQEELLGLRLLSLHNLHFLLELTAGARAAIERGELGRYTAAALARLAARPTGGLLGTADRSRRDVRPALAVPDQAPAPTCAGPAAARLRFELGDEILTAGGIYGTVLEVRDGDELVVEIAPGRSARGPAGRRGGPAPAGRATRRQDDDRQALEESPKSEPNEESAANLSSALEP